MQVNQCRWLIGFGAVLMVGCSTAIPEEMRMGSGFIAVSESSWAEKQTTPYPFTVVEGEISCGVHPAFGREVYFEPMGYTDESHVGIPLNQSAVQALKHGNLSTTVLSSIKAGANLTEAVHF